VFLYIINVTIAKAPATTATAAQLQKPQELVVSNSEEVELVVSNSEEVEVEVSNSEEVEVEVSNSEEVEVELEISISVLPNKLVQNEITSVKVHPLIRKTRNIKIKIKIFKYKYNEDLLPLEKKKYVVFLRSLKQLLFLE
jgi:hypothetical protein